MLAKSAFHHSMNYRSVVVFATGRRVEDEDERRLALDLGEASAKVRTGPPKDDEADADWPAWTGVIPITTVRGTPVPAPGD